MSARFHRLEALFGGPLEQVTFAELAALVGNPEACEDEDLDYKVAHYGPEKKAELAKDVAALANTVGGVLVLGLADDRKSRVPTAVVPVELTDGRLRQIRAVIASNLRPVPRIELMAKQDAPGSTQGILLIAVPRSLDGPHAVVEHNQDHRLAYPRRDGDTTRWLTEIEVATAYRRRFQQLTERGERIEHVDNDIEDTTDHLVDDVRVHRMGRALLTVALVPDVPGDMIIDNRALQRVTEQELRAVPLLGRTGPTFTQTRVGPRRIVLLDDDPAWCVAELHSDGSGAWGMSLETWLLETSETNPWGQGADTDEIVTLVMSALRHLAQHAATRAGASGTAAIRTRLISRTATNSPVPAITASRWQPIHLAHQRLVSGKAQRSGVTARRIATGQAHALVDDLADGGTGLVQAASLLIGDLFQHYGLAEAPQITRDGTINASAWASDERARILTWARQAGVAN
ncbi:helix-turn-helix domain-containing protein [Kitasatospora sp. NPDC057542]|uniref:AlbA family DNA-binding domain-containing protein n=1 Tax=Kitasatospora sp. NPDC057542 TaxID=3346162 RepID=UPI00368A2483